MSAGEVGNGAGFDGLEPVILRAFLLAAQGCDRLAKAGHKLLLSAGRVSEMSAMQVT
jgi:hypothetical protein